MAIGGLVEGPEQRAGGKGSDERDPDAKRRHPRSRLPPEHEHACDQ